MHISFSHARLTLTLWYCLILCSILTVFSIFLYNAQSQNFAKVVLQRDFGSNPPRRLTKIERNEILAQMRILRSTTFFTLITIDGVIMLFGAGLSYFLAGKTLSPIEHMLEKQKEFLANASHELRTPLAALQTSTEVALRNDKSNEEYKSVLRQSHEESKRLGKIVNDLLLLSRADSQAISLSFETLDLRPVILSCVQDMEPFIKAKQITVETGKVQPLPIQGDADKLKQLVLILLDNAIKYSNEHATISIETEKKQKPVFVIHDSGIGMNPEEIKQIFHRFYRADSSRSTPGTGLGLSIAKWIADMHHAKISVRSSVGKGSSFLVTFFPGR